MSYTKKQKQKLYDTGCVGLSTQNFERSMSANGMCAYRGHHDRKCALGQNISDKDYFPKMEGRIPYLERKDSLPFDAGLEIARVLKAKDDEDITFLVNFQNCHDDSINQTMMISALIGFAQVNGLKVHPLLT